MDNKTVYVNKCELLELLEKKIKADNERRMAVVDRDFIDLVNDATEINDVVEVVRCKDCKHAQRQVMKKSGGFEGWICEYDQEHFTAGDHFCSSGERREE